MYYNYVRTYIHLEGGTFVDYFVSCDHHKSSILPLLLFGLPNFWDLPFTFQLYKSFGDFGGLLPYATFFSFASIESPFCAI